MDIHLIDEFRRRTNASYDEARNYLEMYNGDLLEAIIAFERERTVGYQGHERTQRRTGAFLNGLIRAVQALFDIKVIVTDRNMKAFAVPIIILIVLGPVWHVLIPLAIVMLILGFRFNVKKESDPNINIENIVNNIRDKMNQNSSQGRP